MNINFAKGMLWRFKSALPGFCEEDAESEFICLMHHYTEPARKYHNIFHIENALEVYDNLVKNDGSIDKHIVLGIFYHDAIYDAKSKTNEFDSAELFRGRWANSLGADFVDAVSGLILTTSNYTDCGSQNVLGDCDLAGLGASWPVYEKNSYMIREEYASFNDAAWVLGRGQFLSKMLALPRIYSSQLAHEVYEQRARCNMQRELNLLGSKNV